MDYKKLSRIVDSESKINDFESFNPYVKNGGESFQVGDFKCWAVPFVEDYIAETGADPDSINKVGVILPCQRTLILM